MIAISKKGLVLATAAASLFVSVMSSAADTSTQSSSAKPVKCHGINSCKGKGACGEKGGHSCAGQNSCKGKGWLVTKTSEECVSKGGKPEPEQ